MTKITVDRALIEQALDSVKDFMEYREMRSPSYLRDALRATLAEPAVEPVPIRDMLIQAASMAIVLERRGTYQSATRVADAVLESARYTSPPPPAEPAVEPSTDDSSVLSACQKLAQAFKTSPPPPAEPAVEPFGYFRAEPFGWTDCAPTDEGAKALYEVPPPAEPARTSQDVCTVPLLSDEEIIDAGLSIDPAGRYMDKSESEFARAIEQLVRRKVGLK